MSWCSWGRGQRSPRGHRGHPGVTGGHQGMGGGHRDHPTLGQGRAGGPNPALDEEKMVGSKTMRRHWGEPDGDTLGTRWGHLGDTLGTQGHEDSPTSGHGRAGGPNPTPDGGDTMVEPKEMRRHRGEPDGDTSGTPWGHLGDTGTTPRWDRAGLVAPTQLLMKKRWWDPKP